MTKEVIEKIARIICEAQEGNCFENGCPCLDKVNRKVEAILALTYPCKNPDCNRKIRPVYIEDVNKTSEKICPACNGTGQGEPMLAVLDENQELPEVHDYGNSEADTAHYEGMMRMRDTMFNAGWRKLKEVK